MNMFVCIYQIKPLSTQPAYQWRLRDQLLEPQDQAPRGKPYHCFVTIHTICHIYVHLSLRQKELALHLVESTVCNMKLY